MNTIVNYEVEQFDWVKILCACHMFEQSKYNPNIFEHKNIASISARDKIIHIHPGDERVLDIILPVLAFAVSSFFGVDAVVTMQNRDTICVSFKRSMQEAGA